MNKNLYLYPLFPPKTLQLRNSWAQRYEILYVYFLAIVEQILKRFKRKKQKLVPVSIIQAISYITFVTSEWLDPALRHLFHSYSRTN